MPKNCMPDMHTILLLCPKHTLHKDLYKIKLALTFCNIFVFADYTSAKGILIVFCALSFCILDFTKLACEDSGLFNKNLR